MNARVTQALCVKNITASGDFPWMYSLECPGQIFDQATKGVRRMPRHREAMKDVATCDKPRFAGSKLTRGFPNGETRPGKPRSSRTEYIGAGRQPGELKHLSIRRKRKQFATPSVAASERGRAQTIGMSRPYPLCQWGCGTYCQGRMGLWGSYKTLV